MDNFYLSALLAEIRPVILHKTLARISLTGSALLFDFRLPEQLILRASFDAASPALFLAQPGKETINDAHPFLTTLRKEIAAAQLISITKPALDRIVLFEFENFDVSGEKALLTLVVALTGRSANAYLLDANGNIKATLNNRGSFRVNDHFTYDETVFEPDYLLKHLFDSTTQIEIV